jgi:hypothetical protein
VPDYPVQPVPWNICWSIFIPLAFGIAAAQTACEKRIWRLAQKLEFAHEVIGVVENHLVFSGLFYFGDDVHYFPVGTVHGVVKEDEAVGFKEFIAVLEIALDEIIGVVAVDVAKAERAA